LTSVTSSSARNVIAVGFRTNAKTQATRTYIEHFNGRKWRRVKSPNPFNSNELLSVTTDGFSTWAVGYGVNRVGTIRTVILDSYGGKWHAQHSPISGYSILNSVSANGYDHVYAVGSYRRSTGVDPITCFATYNGRRWRVEPAKV